MVNKNLTEKVMLLEKPSGTIAIAGGDLDTRQRKFYNGFLLNAKKELLKNPNVERFTISLNELKKTLNIIEDDKNNTYYKKLIKELYEVSIEYNVLKKDKEEYEIAHLLDNVRFEINLETKETIIRYTIPIMIKKSLLKILKGDPDSLYARIDLVIIKGLKSKYSVILYELCKDYEKVEIPEMTIEQFKKIFGIENKKSYNGSSGFINIKQRILYPSIKELNDNPDIDFKIDYKLRKSANKYTHIKFIVTPKKLKQIKQSETEAEKPINLNSLMLAIPEEHRTKQLEKYLAKCLENHDAKYILRQIEYTTQQKFKNFFAYLKKAIEEDYANHYDNLEKEKQEQEIRKKEFERRLKQLEEERETAIEIAIDNEKTRIYKEYLNLLEDEDKKELLKKYLEKAKELYPDVDEKSYEMEFKVERLIVEDIIAENKLFQMRLEKAKAKAEERAQILFEAEKKKLIRQFEQA